MSSCAPQPGTSGSRVQCPSCPTPAATVQVRSTLMARRHPDQPLAQPPPYSCCGLLVPTSSVSHFLLGQEGQLGWSLVSKPLPVQTADHAGKGSRCQVTCPAGRRPWSHEPLGLLYLLYIGAYVLAAPGTTIEEMSSESDECSCSHTASPRVKL